MNVYEIDGYCGDFTATVLSCEKTKNGLYEIALNRTAFFPEGGGQTSDTGTLGGQEVRGLRTDTERFIVYHTVEKPILPGTVTQGHIDMEKRFSDMQNHTAEHIISGTVHKLYGYDNVGFHMGSDEITMDFNGMLSSEQIADVERIANQAVYANLPVQITFRRGSALKKIDFRSKKEMSGFVRLVDIKNVDICACCAPHVKRTGEIGLIKIIGCQKYKGGVRVSMLAGKRAMEELSKRFTQIKYLSAQLSSKPDNVEERVLQLQNEIYQLKCERSAALQKYYALRAENIASGNGVLIFEDNGSMEDIRAFVNILAAKAAGICAVFIPEDNKAHAYRFIMADRAGTLQTVATKLKETLGAKCGGSAEMIQGSVCATEKEIRDFLKIN